MNGFSEQSNIPSGAESRSLHELEEKVESALNAGVFSGISTLIASPQKVLLEKTWGLTRLDGIAITPQTRFDLASLTKPLATTTLFIWAVGRGDLDLDDSIDTFLPSSIVPNDKRNITLRHLLNHCSGLPSWRPFYRDLIRVKPADRSATLIKWTLRTPLKHPPGKRSRYSDLGFYLLGFILESTTGKSLNRLFHDIVLKPLQIEELAFIPLKNPTSTGKPAAVSQKSRLSFAATERCPWRRRLLEGEVHDEHAYCLGGVAPHAGLFGTSRGIFCLLSFLWNVYRGKVKSGSWRASVLGEFWRRQGLVRGSTWALGFDTPSAFESSSGDFFSAFSVGHLGFTGTSFWMDTEQEVLVVVLTNRIYPSRDDERIRSFRPVIHNLLMRILHEIKRG